MTDITKLLIEFEGFKNKVYTDSAGLPTIGVGHLLTKDELTSGKLQIADFVVRYVNGLSDTQVRQLLAQDLLPVKQAISILVKVPLMENQKTALQSFVFNVGVTAFKNSTLLKRLNSGDYESVPFELMRWVYSGGKFNTGLEHRRKTEFEVWNGTR